MNFFEPSDIVALEVVNPEANGGVEEDDAM
jgi:hypothetical protein